MVRSIPRSGEGLGGRVDPGDPAGGCHDPAVMNAADIRWREALDADIASVVRGVFAYGIFPAVIQEEGHLIDSLAGGTVNLAG